MEEAENGDINGEHVEEMGKYKGEHGEQLTKDSNKNNGEVLEGPISLVNLIPSSHGIAKIPCSSRAKAKEKGREKQAEIEKFENNIQGTRVRKKKVGEEKDI